MSSRNAIPARIWFSFDNPQTVVRFSFKTTPHNDASTICMGATKFAFFASGADDCEDTTKHQDLYVYTGGKGFGSRFATQMHNIDNTQQFKCYGLRIEDVPGYCNSDGILKVKSAMVSQLNFWAGMCVSVHV
jgi:hypothetical protein